MQMPPNSYLEVITGRRWKLVEAVWLLHGIFMQTKKEYGTVMEIFYSKEYREEYDKEQEVGRLPEEFIDRMLKVNVEAHLTAARIDGWETLSDDFFSAPYDAKRNLIDEAHEAVKLEEKIRKFWHLLNCHSDIKQCEVSYVDKNGKWYAISPESQWNADYLIYFAKEQGLEVQWLIDKRYKETGPSENVLPFRKGAN